MNSSIPSDFVQNLYMLVYRMAGCSYEKIGKRFDTSPQNAEAAVQNAVNVFNDNLILECSYNVLCDMYAERLWISIALNNILLDADEKPFLNEYDSLFWEKIGISPGSDCPNALTYAALQLGYLHLPDSPISPEERKANLKNALIPSGEYQTRDKVLALAKKYNIPLPNMSYLEYFPNKSSVEPYEHTICVQFPNGNKTLRMEVSAYYPTFCVTNIQDSDQEDYIPLYVVTTLA